VPVLRRLERMAWLLVVLAGLLETGFAVCLKMSSGLSRVWPTVGFALFALGSFGLLNVALKRLEIGPAYAVWTGIGAAGTVIYGMLFLDEAVTVGKIVCLCLIVAGVIGLNLFGPVH
jgi:quaternary ammonium compound-resistance protein SugE